MPDLFVILLTASGAVLTAAMGTLLARYRTAALLPATLYLGSWTVGMLSYVATGGFFRPIGNATLMYVTVTFILALIGGGIGLWAATRPHGPRAAPRANALVIPLALLSLIGAVGVAVISLQTFADGNIGQFFANTDMIRIRRFEWSAEGTPPLFSVLEYLGYGYMGVLALAILGRAQRAWVPITLSVLAAALLSVFGASRTPALLALLVSLLCLGLRDDILVTARRLLHPRTLLLGFIAWVGLSTVAYTRDTGVLTSYELLRLHNRLSPPNPVSATVLSNTLYMSTSLVNLHDYLTSAPRNLEPLTWGRSTFAGALTPLRRLGVELPERDQIIELGGPTLRQVFGARANYNLYTAHRDLMLDFGVLGALLFFALHMIAASVLCSAVRGGSMMQQFLAAVMLTWVAASIFLNIYNPFGKALLSGVVFIALGSLHLRLPRVRFSRF